MRSTCHVITFLSTAGVCFGGAIALAIWDRSGWGWFLIAGLAICGLAFILARNE